MFLPLHLANLVPQANGFFKLFHFNGSFQALLHLSQLHLRLRGGLGQPSRALAQMVRGTVDALEEIDDVALERGVAFIAPQPADLPEVVICHAAPRAGFGRDLFLHLGGLAHIGQAGQQVGEPEMALHLRPFLVGAGLAQVQLGHLVVDDLGQMHRRLLLLARLANHLAY
ncbi:MAG: hypothetical protein A2105_03115 [Omnitrophica WOR_2 bacterium GWF2_63_9]|nr:MAG: hypothetical protein A2105_03115 [Omnitrophica WOR_2 bacterium GWF2_63_9]